MLPCQRDLFFLDGKEHYLNCAYLSPTTRLIEEAALEALTRMRRPSGITPEMFFTTADDVRRTFATIINARNPNRIAILPSVSYGIATVARNANVCRGQRIVVAAEQFPSNVYSWRRLASETGAVVKMVSPDPIGAHGSRVLNDRILESIDSDTAVVAVPQVHWAYGTRFDLAAVGRRARDVGALFVIDGSQSVGAVPTDVETLQPDALICAGYKWLFGPYSVCLGYYGPRLLEGVPLEENWIARAGSEDFAALVRYRDEYQPGAIRFDVGERSNFLLLPMMLSGLRHVDEWGPARIQAYCASLMEPRLSVLEDAGFRVEPTDGRYSHLVGLQLPPGLAPTHASASLRSANVHVSVRGSAIRVSPHVYNDERDIDIFLDTLLKIAGR